jgi:hypothetical protein
MDAGGRVTQGAVTERSQRKTGSFYRKGAKDAKKKSDKTITYRGLAVPPAQNLN